MELRTFLKWQQTQDVEVFYSHPALRLTFKKYGFLYSQSLSTLHCTPYVTLEAYGYFPPSTRVLSLQVASFSPNLFAIQRRPDEIVSPTQDIIQADTGHSTFLRLPKGRELVGYHWISNPVSAHFVLIDDQSIGFYAFQEQSFRLVHLKTCAVNVGHYWYEPESGVVLVASQPPKLGLMNSYFVHSAKAFEGEKFFIDVAPSVTNRWTTSFRLIHNLASKASPATEPDPHRILLTRLYAHTYLIHLHCIKGLASISVLTPEGAYPLQELMTVSPGVYDLRVTDNLLVFQNYSDQMTFVYDVMTTKSLTQPFCTIWNNIPNRDTVVTVKLIIDRDRTRYFPLLTVLYDGVDIANLASFRLFIDASERENTIENDVSLDRTWSNVSEDVSIKVGLGRCYRLLLNPEELAKGCRSLKEQVLFLLRRSDGKQLALKYLYQGIRAKTDIGEVGELLDIIVKDYHSRAAFLAGDTVTQRRSTDFGLDRMFRSYSISVQMEEKQKHAVTQSEMHMEVMVQLYEVRALPLDYLVSVILAYFRALDCNDLLIHPNLQLTFAQFLIRRGAFSTLVEMISFHILEDSYELAVLLCALGRASLLQQGLDMLLRLDCWEDLLRTLLESGLGSEFLYAVRGHEGVVSVELLELFVKTVKDDELRKAIVRMSREWSYGSF